MDTSKIIKGAVSSGRYTVTAPIVKEDYGLYLKIEGVELPPAYQVDFSNSENSGTSVTMIGNADGVLIPHQFISAGKDVFAFLYHVGEDFGRTVYKFRIPNKVRPDRTNEQPTPEEQSVIDQTISALNEAVEDAQDAQEAIENMSVSATTLAEGSSATVTKTEQEGVVHLAFGIPRGATGAQGERGEKGENGLTIVMQTSSYVIPTGTDGVLTENVRLSAVFRAYQGNTPLMGVVKSADKIIMDDPNNPDDPLRCAWATGAFPNYDITTNVKLLSGYKMHDGDSGTFRITITVNGIDYVLNPSWAVAKRGAQGIQGERGLTGAKGDKGDKGDTGATGAQGERGPQGIQGETGPQGPQGDDYVLTAQDKQDIAELVDVPVDDVQINGSSIVVDGVANVPTASASRLGVVKTSNENGIYVNSDGALSISEASSADVKTGTNVYKPITPHIEHEATFYGLAKASGDTTQSQSSNAVGNYTEDAKIAIQKMLGIYQAPWELIREDTFTNAEEADHIISTDANGETFELTDVVLELIVPTHDEDTTHADYCRVYLYNNNTVVSTVYLGSSQSKTITANSTSNMAIASATQDNGLMRIEMNQWGTRTQRSAKCVLFTETLETSAPYRINSTSIDSIKIGKVTGLMKYRLYGRRKWQ